MNNDFTSHLFNKYITSLPNNYEDNYDYLRFAYQKKPIIHLTTWLKNKFKKKYLSRFSLSYYSNTLFEFINNYNEKYCWLYDKLNNSSSKELLVEIIVYRILGRQHIKLPLNNQKYWESIQKVSNLADHSKKIKLNFLNWELYFFDLNKIGYDLKFYYNTYGIIIDFVLEQYAYKNKDFVIQVESGDYIIDAGACWGDTALYFASKIKGNGKVYSFEFIPKNIDIFKKNIEYNNQFSDIISIIENPLWDTSDKKVYFIDNGPASKVSFEPINDSQLITQTISIDNFIDINNIPKINFIKMDIEGAETYALKGAEQTIRKFKPVLAIALYHSLDDFYDIPKWIDSLNLGYKFYLGHYTIHKEETVLFAKV